MTPEEIAAEEAKVKELSKFIYDFAIQNLIRTLSKNENIPTDSQSLRETFHQNGLNIRYLGRIAEEIKDKNLTHMKFLLEREVIMRTMKHLLNKYLRECPSADMMADTVSHVLNCLLAPKDFQKKMDDGIVKPEQRSLKQLAELHFVKSAGDKPEAHQEKQKEQVADEGEALPSGRKSRKARGKKGKQETETPTANPEAASDTKDASAYLDNI